MIWRSTSLILASFLAAGLGVCYAPALMEPLGLGAFAFVGQVCLPVLALSVLEAVFSRHPAPAGDC